MTETRVTYLRRVLPDIEALSLDVDAALIAAEHGSESYNLNVAIGRAQRLLDDLIRAGRAS